MADPLVRRESRDPAKASRAIGGSVQKIWTKEGIAAGGHQPQRAARIAAARPADAFAVELAMRYQNPSIESGHRQACGRKASTDLLVFPLFPHFAMSSFETAVVRAQEVAARLAPEMRLKIAEPYYNDPDYIAALVGERRGLS